MKKERNAFAAGLFILISIALAIGIIIGIDGMDHWLEPMQHRTVQFTLTDNLNGLGRGDDVRLGGVKVGQVHHIDYVPDLNGGKPRLIVSFTMPGKYILRDGAIIGVESTVTGGADLNITSLGDGNAIAEQVALVGNPGALSQLMSIGPTLKDALAHVGDVIAKAGDTLDSFKQTSNTANATLAQAQSKIDPMVVRYNTLADHSTEMVVNIRDMIGASTLDFKGTMASLNASMTTVKEKLPGILDGAHNTLTKIQGTIDNAAIAMEDLKKTLASTRDITASAKGIVSGNRAKFDGIISSLKTASDNVKHATAELRTSPWRLLYKPAPGELNNLTLFDSTREFSEGANNLNDAVQALRDAVNTGGVPADELRKKIDHLDASFDKFNSVEQKLWKTVKE